MKQAPQTFVYQDTTMHEIAENLSSLLGSLQTLTRDAQALTRKLSTGEGLSLPEQWVRSHGEAVTKKEALEILGIKITHLNDLIREGALGVTPDKRVLVRDMAVYATGRAGEKRKRQRRAPVLEASKRFIP